MRTNFTRSIRFKFTVALVGVVASILVIFSAALIRYNVRAIDKQLLQRLADASRLAQVSLASALWQYNHKFVEDFVESLFLYEDIVFVAVGGETKTIVQKSRGLVSGVDFAALQESKQHVFKETMILYEAQPVGKIRIVLTRGRIRQAVLYNTRNGVFLLLVVSSAILMTNLLLTRRFLFHPLNKLKKSAKQIANGDWDSPVGVTGNDEVGQLGRAFELMIRNLKEVTASRDELNEEIRKRLSSEQALRRERDRAQNYLDIAAVVMLAIDRQGNVAMINKRGCELLGLPEKEILGHNWSTVFVPSHEQATVTAILEQALRGEIEPVAYYENEIKIGSGELRRIAWHNTVLRDEAGNVQGTLSSGEDITERNRVKADRDRSLSQLQATLEATTDGILVVDRDAKIRIFNKRFRTMWQIPDWVLETSDDRQALAMAAEQLADPDTFLAKVQELFDDPRARSEDTFAFKDGRVFERYSRPQILNGKIIGRVWSFRDVTKARRDEAEKAELEAQLRQTYKMEAIGTLAGGIAHELNNILGIIIGNTELAIDDIPQWNPARSCLAEIRRASLRAADVVRQVMSFSHKTPASRKPVNIGLTVKDALKLIRASIPANIEILPDIGCQTEMVLADPTAINQILMNLCSNAAHALKQDTGQMKISLEPVSLDHHAAAQFEDLSAGRYVKLTVRDAGSGIAPEIMDRIFDPYFTTKEVDEGLGMGLAVVYGIIKKHEGAIRIVSHPGQGTKAEVLFPQTEAQTETTATPPGDLPAGHERVLFVDDEASLVQVGTQILKRLGYRVSGHASSREALDQFQKTPDAFDLIITDMAMPEITGDRLARECREIRPHIPVILCTGHSDRIDEERAAGLGIKAYLLKPLNKSSLAKTVRKVLDEASPAV